MGGAGMRVLAAETLVDAARPGQLAGRVRTAEIRRVLTRPDYALYIFRTARSRSHPLWTGEGPDPGNPWTTGGTRWERVQAAARILELPETEPVHEPVREDEHP